MLFRFTLRQIQNSKNKQMNRRNRHLVSEFRSECPSGGIMFEKVLKRLCPCFNKSDECKLPGCENKTSALKRTLRLTEDYSNPSTTNSETTSGTTTTSTTTENWKGTLNIVQPQPIYAFPVDLKKSGKKNQKNLLKPPLYWKKTKKNLISEGPPVFQRTKKKKSIQVEKKKRKQTPLKHSDTAEDLSSIFSSNAVESKRILSRSLDFAAFETFVVDNTSSACKNKESLNYKYDEDKENRRRIKNHKDHEIFPDIAHGVIYFTAAYFSKKKIFLVNIDRLKNLSKKGRNGNSYHSIVKLALLPCEKYIRCTKILNNTSCPEVKQDFSFTVKDITGKVLRLSVFDVSFQVQHEAVGHALFSLDNVKQDQSKKYRLKLYRRTRPYVCPGNLALSLNYSTEEGKLIILVDEGRNLVLQKEKNVKLNTYVKVSLYYRGEKVKTKKSPVVFDSTNPNYNSVFTFQIRKDQIDYTSLLVNVRLKGFVNDVTIGRLNFGPFFFVENHTLTPWGRVFLKRECVSHWFRLYL